MVRQFGMALLGVGLATLLFWLVRDFFGEGDLAQFFLPVVALLVWLGDARTGVYAALLGFFAGKFFFVPPYYSLGINDPKDWVSLTVSLILGLALGVHTKRREQEATLLYQVSSLLSLETSIKGLGERLMGTILPQLGVRQAALFLPGQQGMEVAASLPPDLTVPPRRSIELQASGGVEGVLYVDSTARYRLLQAVAHLTAAFLERQRLQSAASHAEVLEETDRLKTVLVSSVSHELRTPLASVTATLTNLLEPDVRWDPDVLRPDLLNASRDLERLNDGIGSLLDLSRLESGTWVPRRDWCELGEVLGTLLKRLPPDRRSRVHVKLEPDLPPLFLDYAQWLRALQNLVENALDYSADDIEISAALTDTGLHVRVDDRGPGVDAGERQSVFEKFYRGRAAAARPSGSGLGLAITRDIVESHGGKVWVEERPGGGARFVVTAG